VILVIHAHPYPGHSRAGNVLLTAAREVPDVRIRSLYDLYPDFDIDATAEQNALYEADRIVWLHPLYWYSPPALLKHWFEKVLVHGWAYGPEGNALKGKRVLWAPTTGGDAASYSPQGMHEHVFPNFVTPVEETARYCGMVWEEPFIVHGAHLISNEELAERGLAFKQRLTGWSAPAASADEPAAMDTVATSTTKAT
jgi:glutathione-regulated potassium-efflux system ancillary protein KefF